MFSSKDNENKPINVIFKNNNVSLSLSLFEFTSNDFWEARMLPKSNYIEPNKISFSHMLFSF